MMQQLIDLYKQWSGNEPASVDKMQGAGSNRQYFRLTATDGSSVVGVIGTRREEDHAFINIAKQFAEQKLPVPQVLAVSSAPRHSSTPYVADARPEDDTTWPSKNF